MEDQTLSDIQTTEFALFEYVGFMIKIKKNGRFAHVTNIAEWYYFKKKDVPNPPISLQTTAVLL